MKISRLFIALSALFVACDTTVAQAPYLYFNRLTTQNGLSHNKVNCILQDRRGFIWMGTDDGLNRYDGHYFTIFRHQHNDPTTISGNIITALFEDENDVLWIGTADGGSQNMTTVSRLAISSGNMCTCPTTRTQYPTISSTLLCRIGMVFLWIATGTKWVLRFDKNSRKIWDTCN